MLKILPIILFLYAQNMRLLFFSRLPIILKLFSINNGTVLIMHKNSVVIQQRYAY